MKRNKVVLILILAIIFSFLLAACQNEESNNTPSGTPSGEINSGDSNLPSGDNDNTQEVDDNLVFTKTAESTYQLSSIKNKNISEVVIPDTYKGKPVTSIADKVFENCKSLTSIEIPKSIINIGYSVFDGCDALAIYCVIGGMPNGWNDNWNSMGCPIIWDSQNNDVADDGYIYTIYQGMRYAIKDNQATVAKQPIISGGKKMIPSEIKYEQKNYAVTSIGKLAFSGCDTLKSVVLPNSVKIIDKSAFRDCYSLSEVIMSKNLTSIEDFAFAGCTALETIELPKAMTSIGQYAFDRCVLLSTIVLPISVTQVGDYAFNNCNLLTILCEASSEPSGFGENWSFNRPIYWESTSILGTDENFIYTLTPNGRAQIVEILQENIDVVVPCTFEGKEVYINNSAFNNISLNSITLLNGVKEIRENAFNGCVGLEEITIPSSVEKVGANIFEGCLDLKRIYCKSSEKPIGWSEEWDTISQDENYYIIWDVEEIRTNSTYEYAVLNNDTVYITKSFQETVSPVPDTIDGMPVVCFTTIYQNKNLSSISQGGGSIVYIGYDDRVPADVVSLGKNITTIVNKAFVGCNVYNELLMIIIANPVKNIGKNIVGKSNDYITFTECLLDIEEWLNVELEDETSHPLYYRQLGIFPQCLTGNIIIPDTITELKPYVFYNSSMDSVYIPESVKTIDNTSFLNCSKDTIIYCQASAKPDSWPENWNHGCQVVWNADKTNQS